MLDLNYDGLGISVNNYVAVVEIQRGPNNFFDTQMISLYQSAHYSLTV